MSESKEIELAVFYDVKTGKTTRHDGRFNTVRELVKDPSLRVTDIAKQTGYNKGHVSRLRKEVKGKHMAENKSAKTPADGSMVWSCQCGRPYTVTCISSKSAKREWVGLTEPELHQINPTWPAPGQHWDYEDVLAFVRAIEAKLKVKNGE
jgi:hypothetical protein